MLLFIFNNLFFKLQLLIKLQKQEEESKLLYDKLSAEKEKVLEMEGNTFFSVYYMDWKLYNSSVYTTNVFYIKIFIFIVH